MIEYDRDNGKRIFFLILFVVYLIPLFLYRMFENIDYCSYFNFYVYIFLNNEELLMKEIP